MSDFLQFDNFNFKLAIIQELMYEQNVLEPRFDVYSFCESENLSVDPEDFYETPIPEVEAYFEQLEIPKEYAQNVESLFFDGGNDIYAQLIPLWDGEDDQFDLGYVSEKELSQFSNLKIIDGTIFPFPKEVRDLFESKGIEIEE